MQGIHIVSINPANCLVKEPTVILPYININSVINLDNMDEHRIAAQLKEGGIYILNKKNG